MIVIVFLVRHHKFYKIIYVNINAIKDIINQIQYYNTHSLTLRIAYCTLNLPIDESIHPFYEIFRQLLVLGDTLFDKAAPRSLAHGGVAPCFQPGRILDAFDQPARAILVQVLEAKW